MSASRPLFAVLLSLVATAVNASQLTVFGDSYSDTDARYPLWHEYLAYFLGTTSTSYAIGGANSQRVYDEVLDFLGDTNGNAPADDLYFVAPIGNDLVDGNSVSQAITYTTASVSQLQSAGAIDIVLFNIFNVDITPLAGTDPDYPADSAAWIADYNNQLKMYGLSEPHVRVYDFFSFSNYLAATVPAAELWADSVHMKTDIHKMIARDVEAFLAQPVPIPDALWLFASSLIGMAGIARKGKSIRRSDDQTHL